MNDLIILALLTGSPKHGYRIKREAGCILSHRDMHNNLVYPWIERQRRVQKQMPRGEMLPADISVR